ncbi:hypothetical protein GGS23DRAFT_207325 [Durotheca rogersii]|uniref:uncharacterized protein n=1 Tax=Durotheca rogersii TaxID=419775 RepID=UPI00221EAC67|nr:uncharacterized protein GGS23DRAFT_207325 [Durotheca rogersii]KAI5861068.1 hypothetical protein GGS23DRAFT_207325 [Durotheca rogersii]
MATSGEMPEGLGRRTIIAAVLLCFFSVISVSLRLWVRLKIGARGLDDLLMTIALMFFIGCVTSSSIGCFSGIGATDEVIQRMDPSGEMHKNAVKMSVIFNINYMWCHGFIKTAICTALLRITKAKRYVIPIWVVMLLSVVFSFIGFIIVMTRCTPLAANWEHSAGVCNGIGKVGKISIAVSGISILTDWSCAIIPAFILWNLNMKLSVKLSLAFVLALGILASVSTCIRLQYLPIRTNHRNRSQNALQNLGYIIMWSIAECGIGIIAGSLPPLRPLFNRCELNLDGRGMRAYVNNILETRGSQKNIPSGARSIRLDSLPNLGDLRTNCLTSQRQSRWPGSQTVDGSSSRKLLIVKDTRIDVEFGAADAAKPASRNGT